MRVSFEETMSGTLSAGELEHPVSFTVTASSEGKGFFTLSGTISAPPFVERAPVHGSLRIHFGLRSSIRYHLQFQTPRGVLTLKAEKTPSPLSPVRSMTFMPATLKGPGGETLAQGSMRFALSDLPGFVLSAFKPAPLALPKAGR